MTQKIDIENLSLDELEAIHVAIEAKKKANDERRKSEVKTYLHLRDETVKKVFEKLTRVNADLENIKKEVFEEFGAVLEMKNGLFGINEDQFSHTFTTNDGALSIVLGHNTIDRWDETISAGIDKVNDWLARLAKDDDSAVLVGFIRDLLKPNKEGILKANRVLELAKKADEIGDQELIDGVKIIRDSHRPDRTSTFVKAIYKDKNGIRQNLGLSMSSV